MASASLQRQSLPCEAEESRPQNQLEEIRWSTLRSMEDMPDEWLWEPFLPKISFGAFASLPKHGKSMLSLQLGVSLATGLPLFGFPTQGPIGVGVMALEDSPKVLRKRMRAIVAGLGSAWKEEHDRLLDANLRLLVRSRRSLQELSAEDRGFTLVSMAWELREAMRTTLAAPGLLFVDTLNAVHDGDENSAKESRPLINAAYGISAALNCSVWILHHLRKPGVGRHTPSLDERMSSELIRGSSAIVAGARGIAQLGWITPSEATKVGLEPINCQRRYGILGLTDANDGPPSPWLLLQHSPQSGIWGLTPNGGEILAKLRGVRRAELASKSEALLLDIHRGMPREDLAKKHWPDDPNGDTKLKSAIQDLRRRQEWVQKGALQLTEIGLQKVKELSRQSGDTTYPASGETA